jgi:hypothetical protein
MPRGMEEDRKMPNIPIQVRLPNEECEALDAYRREQRNPPSRAQAARALISRALGSTIGRQLGEPKSTVTALTAAVGA